MAKDPINKIYDRLDHLEKEMSYVINKLDKVMKLFRTMARFFKYIVTEVPEE